MKKLILSVVLLLGLAIPVQAAITFVNQVAASSPDGNTFTTGAVSMTGANFFAVSVSYYTTPPTITDSSSNSWSCLTAHTVGGANTGNRICYTANATSTAAHTFTATCTGCFPAVVAMGFAGVKVTSPFDQQNGATTASGTSLQTGSVTPTEDNELLIAGLGFDLNNTITINESFSTVYQVDFASGASMGVAGAYKIQTTAAAINPTLSWGNTGEAASSIATFKNEAVAAGSSAVPIFYSIR